LLREGDYWLEGLMTRKLASPGTGGTDIERVAHYREQAAQFRQWADEETVPEARDRLLDMARQYERLAIELEAARSLTLASGRGSAAE
jgi:hypothetical protein